MNIIGKSAVELIKDLREGHISALELLEETIYHSERVSEAFNPFAVKLYDRARQAARAADELLAQGLGGALCGLPVTIKDSQWLAGVPCANGSHTLSDFVPDETCAAVRRLEEADAVIFAKTTCPEFSLMGITTSELYGLTLAVVPPAVLVPPLLPGLVPCHWVEMVEVPYAFPQPFAALSVLNPHSKQCPGSPAFPRGVRWFPTALWLEVSRTHG